MSSQRVIILPEAKLCHLAVDIIRKGQLFHSVQAIGVVSFLTHILGFDIYDYMTSNLES